MRTAEIPYAPIGPDVARDVNAFAAAAERWDP